MKKPKPVMVKWYDAYGDAPEWTPLKDLDKKARPIRTCGFELAPKTPGYITIALSWDKHVKYVGGVIHIPTVNIVSKEYL